MTTTPLSLLDAARAAERRHGIQTCAVVKAIQAMPDQAHDITELLAATLRHEVTANAAERAFFGANINISRQVLNRHRAVACPLCAAAGLPVVAA